MASPFDVNARKRPVNLTLNAELVDRVREHTDTIPYVVVLHPLEMVSVPVDRLGPPVGSLADEGPAIIGALDELFSRAWK